MKKLLLLITLISLPSYAAVSANVSFASDYIWRGMTQSDGPAIQGGFDYEADGGFYAGIWGSNVNFNDGQAVNWITTLATLSKQAVLELILVILHTIFQNI